MKTNLLVQRHELKYYLSWQDYLLTKSKLTKLMDIDEYQKEPEGYFIRSLYLDDLYDSTLEDKLAGVEKRDKYRLRIYEFEQDWVKLERKRKLNNFVRKDSVVISREDAEAVASGNVDSLLKYVSTAASIQLYHDLKRTFFRPAVLIDYTRDALKLDYNDIRITFDKQIACSTDHFSLFDPNTHMQFIQNPKVVIMEVKFNHFLPSWISNVLKPKSATNVAISKYTLSRLKISDYFTYASPWD